MREIFKIYLGGDMKNKRLKSLILIVPFFLLIFTVSLSFGQIITAKIAGTVKDDQGTPLPGVTVEATSPNAMGTKTTVTSASGGFRLSNLPPGTYKLVLRLDGFQTVERENIKAAINTTVTFDITMQLATVSEEVIVIAEVPIIDVKKTGLSTNFTSEDLENVPAGRHSFADIVKQAPAMLSQGESGALRWSFGGFGS